MPVLKTTTRCTDGNGNLTCCGEDSEGYWRVVSYAYAPINSLATCVTMAALDLSDECYFGTPFQVLTSAVSGAIGVTCPAGQPADVCGASNAYVVPAIFGNPVRMAFTGFNFNGNTAIATMQFEDCGDPTVGGGAKDVIFTFNLEKCSP